MVYTGLGYSGDIGSWVVESSTGVDESGVDRASVLDYAAVADDYEWTAIGKGSRYVYGAV